MYLRKTFETNIIVTSPQSIVDTTQVPFLEKNYLKYFQMMKK